ncbi:MAG: hypothetical protein LUC90_02025 [Lachnospiraceae bacterium]|nr:hypothetical protein [Lachnospiraceae bacterium]
MEIPKHTTQVGTVSAHKKMYLEDYCISYLRQLDKDYPQEKKQIALYGCLQKEKTVEYAMVFGAALLGLGKARTDSLSMIQKEEAEKIRQASFPDYKLVGLIVGTDTVSQNLYWLGYGSKAITQDGYFIFYDRNEAMLAFMMQREQEEREPDVDPVIAKKADMDQKKQAAVEEAEREKGRPREKEKARETEEAKQGGKYRKQIQKQSKSAKNRKGAEPVRGMRSVERPKRSRFGMAAAAMLAAAGVVYGVRTYLPQDFHVPDVGSYITDLIFQTSILRSEEEGTQEVNAQTPEEGASSLEETASQEEENGNASEELTTQETPLTLTDMDVAEIPDLETMAETAEADEQQNPEAAAQGQSNTEQVSTAETASAEGAGDGSAAESLDTGTSSAAEETQASDEPETYLIQRGDNLLTILRNHYGDDSMLQEVCEVNQIEDADNIQVGQTIVLP